MANITTALLGTAGHAPDQFGAEVIIDLPNNSVMAGLVDAYVIGKGESLTAPVTGVRTLTSVTRGASETAAITFSSISDTGVSFTKAAAYDAFEFGYPTLNDIPPDRLANQVNALHLQGKAATGNHIDTSTLGLWSSASTSVGGGAVDFSIGLLAEAIKNVKVAIGDQPSQRIVAVLPTTQFDHLIQTDELVRFDITGSGAEIRGGVGFRYGGVDIFTCNNCPTAGGIAHGLVFYTGGIRLQIRDMATLRVFESPENLAGLRSLMFTDYAYANPFSDWIVDFQTRDT